MKSTQPHWTARLGAVMLEDNRCQFCVWAPQAKSLDLHLLGEGERYIPMERGEAGYYKAVISNIGEGQQYYFRLDGSTEYADPASRFQPDGVSGASAVVTPAFDWHDQDWRGVPLQNHVIYELHIGTFTPEGTFDSAIPWLDYLVELGVTAVEIMPVAQFPGSRNWGYDAVFPFAPQHSYGGPDGLRRFIDACHQRGLAVVLDVIYNHFGPEGSPHTFFAPYLTDTYHTPWGNGMNFDGAYSDDARAYFIENALYWFYEFHVDSLRLDATHFIYDFSAYTFMEELIAVVHEHRELLRRDIYLIAENDRNDARLLRSPERGGWGMDAVWNDDFHHALHTLLTHETYDYFQGFGGIEHLVKAMREGFVFTGEHSPFRNRRHGTSSQDLPARKFVVFIQNHDQIGNRMPSERLASLVSFDCQKLAAGVIMASPYIPLIFMGDEYGETALFNFFTSFAGAELVEAVRKGRTEEFSAFIDDDFEPPDPQAESTFDESKLNHSLREAGQHAGLLALYRELIRLRKTVPALAELNKERMEVLGFEQQAMLYLRRWNGTSEVFFAFNFADSPSDALLPVPVGYWTESLKSSEAPWSCRDAPDDAPVPDPVQSLGELQIALEPNAFVMYTKQV